MRKGEKYKCIKTVVMDGSNKIAYLEGKTYPCEVTGCLTNEEGDTEHYWGDPFCVTVS